MREKIRVGLLSLLAVGVVGCLYITSTKGASANPEADKRFMIAMKTVLRHEGGYSDTSGDPGGATNWGISLRYLREEKLCENNDCKGDKNEIIHLTQTEADDIYYKNWYEKNHYDKILSQTVLTKILDFSINAGSSQCHKLVKRAINRIIDKSIVINGIMDDQTLEIINLIEPSVFYSSLVAEEEQFYYNIVKRNPELHKFLRGWITRCND